MILFPEIEPFYNPDNHRLVQNHYVVRGTFISSVPGEAFVEGLFFQSYQSIVVFSSLGDSTCILDENYWDYSRTTMKYLVKFLRDENVAAVRAKIKSGEYKLADLNGAR